MAEWISGNILIRPSEERLLKKGGVIPGHSHNFDHTLFVPEGAIHVVVREPSTFTETEVGERIETLGKIVIDGNFGKGYRRRHCLVKKEYWHSQTSLIDGTETMCIYSHQQPQSGDAVEDTGWEVVQEFTGHMEAYN